MISLAFPRPDYAIVFSLAQDMPRRCCRGFPRVIKGFPDSLLINVVLQFPTEDRNFCFNITLGAIDDARNSR